MEELNEILDIYNDPKTGLSSINKIKGRLNNKYSYNDIKNILNNHEAIQILRNKPKVFYPIYGVKKHTYQIDLMFLYDIKKNNKNYDTILNIINVNTRYAYSYPMKGKSIGNIIEAFKDFLKKTKVNVIGSDNGLEFTAKKFEELLNDNNIEHYYSDVNDKHKMGTIERFNRTLRQLMNQLFIVNANNNWVNYLDDLLENYNSRVHSTIKKAPKDMTDEDENEYIKNMQKKTKILEIQKDLHVDDYVRIPLKRSEFDKKTGPKYTKELYKIVEDLGLSYKVESKDGNLLKRKFKAYDLLKIDPDKLILNETDNQIAVNKNRKERSIVRKLNKEGVNRENIIPERRITRSMKTK